MFLFLCTQGELGVLERYVDSVQLQEGMEQLHGAMRGIAGGDSIAALLFEKAGCPAGHEPVG